MTQGEIPSEDIRNRIDELEKRKLIVKDRYESIYEKDFFDFTHNNNKKIVIEAMKQQMNTYSEDISKSQKNLNQRRNLIEKSIDNNTFIKWVELTEFTDPINKEITELGELDNIIKEIQKNLEDPKAFSEKISFQCKDCGKPNDYIISNSDFIDEDEYKEYVTIECPYCNYRYTIELQ